MARVLAEAALDRRGRSERGEDFGHVHARDEFGGKVRHSDHGRLVNLRMLPELDRREVEAERLDLPAEILDLAERHSRQPVGDQAALHLFELGDQLLRLLVASTDWAAFFSKVGPRPAQPLHDRAQPPSVRFVGVPASHVSHRLGYFLGVARQARLESGLYLRPWHVRRDRGQQSSGHGLVAAQQMVGVDARHLACQLSGDRGIAVPVAADPRTPPQECGHACRSRARPTRIARQSRVEGRTPAAAAITPAGRFRRPLKRPIEVPVDARNDPEDGLIEEGHGGPDLVDGTGRQPPHSGRPPQDADLLAQPAPYLGVVVCPETRVVELLEEPVAAPQRYEHRPAPRLGRVSG